MNPLSTVVTPQSHFYRSKFTEGIPQRRNAIRRQQAELQVQVNQGQKSSTTKAEAGAASKSTLADPPPSGGEGFCTSLQAINFAKVVSLGLIVGAAGVYGIHGVRPVVYLGLHASYIIWWLLQQKMIAYRSFQTRVGVGSFILTLVLIGVIYASPSYFALTASNDMAPVEAVLSIGVYSLGSLVNAATEFYKAGVKAGGYAGLINGDMLASCRNMAYFGDIMRYSAICYAAGSPWCLVVVGIAAVAQVGLGLDRDKRYVEKYGSEFIEYQKSSKFLIPFVW